jgi:hypothetical protein
MLKVLVDEPAQEEVAGRSSLDEIARDGARRMLLAALETEVARNVEAHVTDRNADDHAAAERLKVSPSKDARTGYWASPHPSHPPEASTSPPPFRNDGGPRRCAGPCPQPRARSRIGYVPSSWRR